MFNRTTANRTVVNNRFYTMVVNRCRHNRTVVNRSYNSRMLKIPSYRRLA